mmetsp:Transcript_18852/g.49003  ORF Transcript_18852/g.49003 Transcript_18852/m.49003 type:complete len:464 (-) Transcript_18852:105-1496(-)
MAPILCRTLLGYRSTGQCVVAPELVVHVSHHCDDPVSSWHLALVAEGAHGVLRQASVVVQGAAAVTRPIVGGLVRVLEELLEARHGQLVKAYELAATVNAKGGQRSGTGHLRPVLRHRHRWSCGGGGPCWAVNSLGVHGALVPAGAEVAAGAPAQRAGRGRGGPFPRTIRRLAVGLPAPLLSLRRRCRPGRRDCRRGRLRRRLRRVVGFQTEAPAIATSSVWERVTTTQDNNLRRRPQLNAHGQASAHLRRPGRELPEADEALSLASEGPPGALEVQGPCLAVARQQAQGRPEVLLADQVAVPTGVAKVEELPQRLELRQSAVFERDQAPPIVHVAGVRELGEVVVTPPKTPQAEFACLPRGHLRPPLSISGSFAVLPGMLEPAQVLRVSVLAILASTAGLAGTRVVLVPRVGEAFAMHLVATPLDTIFAKAATLARVVVRVTWVGELGEVQHVRMPLVAIGA